MLRMNHLLASGQSMRFCFALGVLAVVVVCVEPAAAVQPETDPARTTFSAEAGAVRMRVSVSKTKAAVADPVELELTVIAPDGVGVFLPKIPAKLGSLEVVGHDLRPDIPTESGREWRQRLTLESIQTGELTIPSIEVGLSGNGEFDRIRTPEIPLVITSLLEDRADPAAYRDIRDVVDLPLPPGRSFAWIGWTAGTLAGAGALIALVVTVMRRRRWMSPRQWTEKELVSIRDGLSSGAQADSDAAPSLAVTLKTFLEMQFGFAATTSTTDQLLIALRHRQELKPVIVDDLGRILQRLDLVTYAGLEFDRQELMKLIDQAVRPVQQIDDAGTDSNRADRSGGGE